MACIDFSLNIFQVPVKDGYYRRNYCNRLSSRILIGNDAIEMCEATGAEIFENVPETGDEQYAGGDTWSQYWEEVSGRKWPDKCRRVGCACGGQDDAVGGHVWFCDGIQDPYHMWIAPICQHTNVQGEDPCFRLKPGTLIVRVDLRYVEKKQQ